MKKFIQKIKKMPVWAKVVSIIVLVLLVLVLGVFIAWAVLKSMGGQSLYDKVKGQKPNLTSLNESGETDIGWQEGWIRYNGKIYEYNDDILTFLVMGTDNEEGEEEDGTGAQSDGNYLVILNPDSKLISVLCINRDTMTDINVYDKQDNFLYTAKAQLALQHSYGSTGEKNAENMKTAVSKLLYDLPINGYAAINMSAIATLNDAVGGVTVTIDGDLTEADPQFKDGRTITLSGEQAYEYVRYRDESQFESSRDRLERQKGFLTTFVEQVKSEIKKNPLTIVSLYNGITQEMVTDLSVDEVTYLASTAVDYSFDFENIVTLEGETEMGERYEEFYPDNDALKDTIISLFYKEVVQE